MTKQEILDKFNDIDFVYNDSSKHETLSRMLDELLKEQEAVVRCKDCKFMIEDDVFQCGIKAGYFPVHEEWFCADGERRS